MKAVFCDVCKQPKNRWYTVLLRIEASRIDVDVSDMIDGLGNYHVCKDCINKIKEGIAENEKQNG